MAAQSRKRRRLERRKFHSSVGRLPDDGYGVCVMLDINLSQLLGLQPIR